MDKRITIEFDSPAAKWDEALPVGNGKLGGMIFADVATERIQLNEDSVWYGGRQDRNNPSAREKLPEIRSLILAGLHLGKEVQEAGRSRFGRPAWKTHCSAGTAHGTGRSTN